LPWLAQLLSWVDWSSEPSFEERMMFAAVCFAVVGSAAQLG
jgi:hypothetical protein